MMNWLHINEGCLDYEAEAWLAVAPPFIYLVLSTSTGWLWGNYSLRGLLRTDHHLLFRTEGRAQTIDEAKQAAEVNFTAHERGREE